ncbi:uncharacterized protein A4U43_C04F1150 [Asparagus officinalis]|uniref:Pentacotripeptide-repeat region of PRORP domain-containing protein n=1 Tax=Asparagus officinalis TaxID=4686 RepID=A0A5P1F218_ASPOF|nr:pentatricopeptide repeat-containing protein At3g09040, mitochondrial [Asparagus officinalis]XP_020259830.1 pentatricopeptide repeat-containing protein At3g09040, mitochondrial [Asparagus officinalis]XP_020259831.1 pentatricopeptide repeat-containing protein At3g09040, mitochondrial [Asparagus officinalis]XP_020259832.1 pentatricopeptide repeat-containing protein At3g09040, mitochondrial [Asparagus officinalis]XP_020259833.1 pentatricopeptide repeat-containing protein At3g09040, mitochondrial
MNPSSSSSSTILKLKRSLSPKPPYFPSPIRQIPSDPQTYTHLLLQQCSKTLALSRAHHAFDEIPKGNHPSSICKVLHARILILGLKLSGGLGNALVDLYSKSGDLCSAQNAFNRLEERTRPSWNSILSAHLKVGSLETVFEVFASMHRHGTLPNEFSFSIVLSAIARMNSLDYGKVAHCQIVKFGLEPSPFCEGSLINMYTKCGCILDARCVFNGTGYPDIISWTTMIEGYVRIGKAEEALQLFHRMQGLGMKPDNVALATVINACMDLGRLKNARDLFREMPLPNVEVWNAIISRHVQIGHEDEGIELFREMRALDVKPTRSTLGSVLSAIASLMAIDYGRAVHSEAIRLCLDSSVFVGSSLINMYAKCNLIEDARRVFDMSNERNVVMWNAMIGGYLHNEQLVNVFRLFFEMKGHELELDKVTFLNVFGACASLGNLELGRQLHCDMIKRNMKGNLFLVNAVVGMYAKCGELNDARQQFELIPSKDNISWSAIISGYTHNEEEDEAIRLFRRMRSEGAMADEAAFSSVINACSNSQAFDEGTQLHCLAIKCNLGLSSYVGSSLIDLYAKLDELEDANKIFTEIPERNVASWNALISGHAQNNKEQEALDLFRQMKIEGVEPSQITFTGVLASCNGPWGLDIGKQIHCNLLKSGLIYGFAFSEIPLLSIYLKAKSLEDANKLFLEMPKSENKVHWTAIISSHTQNGYSEEALILFSKMRGFSVHSDEATYSSILKACADLASLRDGKEVHGLVIQTGFSSYRYTVSALIDMYSKCGDVDHAFQVFKESNNKQDIILWNPMIVGFAKNGFAEEALFLFHRMQESKINPDNVTFLGVLTACSHAGLVSQGRGFFELMSNKYRIGPRSYHYACMIDLLGRGGYLKQAEEFIDKLPFEPDGVIWATMLSACRIYGDKTRGQRAAEKLISLDPHSSSPYSLLSSIYAASGDWDEAKRLRHAMKERGVRKSPGCSWIEVGNNTNVFVAEDKLHPRAVDIYEMLKDLGIEMKEEGYVPELDELMLNEE